MLVRIGTGLLTMTCRAYGELAGESGGLLSLARLRDALPDIPRRNLDETLLELDPADFQAALDEATGKLVAAQADLVAARSGVESAQAQVAAAEAAVAQAKAEHASKNAELQRALQDLAEYTKARDTSAISPVEWGKADTAAQTARAADDAAKKAVAAAEAQVNQAMAAVKTREGQVSVAEAQIQTAQSRLDVTIEKLSFDVKL